MISLANKRVLVTGSTSMIGRNVFNILKDREAIVIETPHDHYDLLDKSSVYYRFADTQPDFCIHLAGFNGNIQFSQKYPADIFYRTALMGLHVLKCCQVFQVKKTVSVLSSCAIADLNKVLEEEDLHSGQPNPTIEAHGYAKRILDIFSRQLHKQYNTNAVTVILNNAYGENDNTDIEKTKMIMGLIKRFIDAKKYGSPHVTLWGSGNPLRSVIYAQDAAECIVQALEKYDDPTMPLNITNPEEKSIKEYAEVIAKLVGYDGLIECDTSKPDGQMRKQLSDKRMKKYINIHWTPLEEGLKNTIEWYKKILDHDKLGDYR